MRSNRPCRRKLPLLRSRLSISQGTPPSRARYVLLPKPGLSVHNPGFASGHGWARSHSAPTYYPKELPVHPTRFALGVRHHRRSTHALYLPEALQLEDLPEGILHDRALDAAPPQSSESDRDPQELAIQLWRLENRIAALSSGGGTRSLEDSMTRLKGYLGRMGVEYEDPTGQEYDDGWLEVEVLTTETPSGPPPAGVEGAWIQRTNRPIVRRGDQLLCRALVIVTDLEEEEQPSGIGRES